MLLNLALTCLLYSAWTPPSEGHSVTEYEHSHLAPFWHYWPISFAGRTCSTDPTNVVESAVALGPADCAVRCAANPACAFFTMGTMCTLHRNCHKLEVASDMSSIPYLLELDRGTKEVCGLAGRIATPWHRVASPTDCAQRCLATQQCHYFTFTFQFKTCQLFETCTTGTSYFWSVNVQAKADEAAVDMVETSSINDMNQNTGRLSINLLDMTGEPITSAVVNFYMNDKLVLKSSPDNEGVVIAILPAGAVTMEVVLPSDYLLLGQTPFFELTVEEGQVKEIPITVEAHRPTSGDFTSALFAIFPTGSASAGAASEGAEGVGGFPRLDLGGFVNRYIDTMAEVRAETGNQPKLDLTVVQNQKNDSDVTVDASRNQSGAEGQADVSGSVTEGEIESTAMSAAEKTEVSTTENAEVSTTENAEVSTTENAEASATENTEESSTENTEESSTENTEESSTENTEESSTENAEESSTENAEESSTENAEESSTENTEASATESTEESATEGATESTEESATEGATEGTAA